MQITPSTTPRTDGRPRLHASPFVTVRADWLARAAQLHGRTLHYAVVLLVLASRGRTAAVAPGPRLRPRYGVSRARPGAP